METRPERLTERPPSPTQSAMRGSRRRFLLFWLRPGVIMTSVPSSASRYQIVVKWELPSLFKVLTTATRSSRRNSLAQLESVFVIDLSSFLLSTVVIGYAILL